MFNSLVDLPVPVTVRPIRMLGGGASGSKNPAAEDRHRRPTPGSRPARTTAAITTAAAPITANVGRVAQTPPAAAHLPKGNNEDQDELLNTSDGHSTLPAPWPTITIFTSFTDDDDGAEGDGGNVAEHELAGRNVDEGTLSNLEASATHSLLLEARATTPSLTRSQHALAETATTLLPSFYPSVRAPQIADDVPRATESASGTFSARNPVMGASAPATTAASSNVETFLREEPGKLASATPHWQGHAAASSLPSGFVLTSSGSSSGWSQRAASCTATTDGSVLANFYPKHLSATPVVLITPHVAAPSSRHKVADDLERLYGTNGTLAATASKSATHVDASAPTSQSDRQLESAGVQAGETPKKNKSGLSLFSFSPSSPKAATKPTDNQAKKKPGQLTPHDRRLEREHVLRVGVHRLYQRLGELQLSVYHVKNDGNCQFRAIAHQLLGNEDYHDIVRSHVVSYMRGVRAECFDFYFESPTKADAYYANAAKSGSWGDELTLRAASDCLYVNIHVLSSEERNCYITYRPSAERAAAAPSFLIDVAKLRERKRAERLLLQARGVMGSTASLQCGETGLGNSLGALSAGASLTTHHTQMNTLGDASTMPELLYTRRNRGADAIPTLLGRNPASASLQRPSCSSPPSIASPQATITSNSTNLRHSSERDDPDDDDADVNADAIQRALHRKLQLSEIRAASMPMSPKVAAAQPVSPQTLLRPAEVPVPRLLSADGNDVSQNTKANQADRFRAAGAEVQSCQDAQLPVHLVSHRVEERQGSNAEVGEDAAPATSPASFAPLLRPQQYQQHQQGSLCGSRPEGVMERRSNSTVATGSGPLLVPLSAPAASARTGQALEETGEVMLLASSLLRSRSASSSHQSFSYMPPHPLPPSFGYTDSCNAPGLISSSLTQPLVATENSVPSVGAGADGNTSTAASLGAFVPIPLISAEGGCDVAADTATTPTSIHAAASCANDGPSAVCFRFEPRTEPIDIFLSYLFPIHYNSLSAEKVTHVEAQAKAAMMSGGGSATSAASSKATKKTSAADSWRAAEGRPGILPSAISEAVGGVVHF